MALSFKSDVSRRIWILGALGASCDLRPSPDELTIAAAADLQFALGEVTRDFRAARLKIVYGSSGNFFAQIQNHAPFDVFLSADAGYPEKLVAQGIGFRDEVFVYAIGRLAVWVPASSSLDPAHALESDSVRHIAIANPQHAPYGRAAEAALRSLGLYDRVQGRLVLGENVSQALEFAESGAAEVGVVALSLALAPPVLGRGRYWEIPPEAYPKMEQTGMIVKGSVTAGMFRTWMLRPAATAILRKYGFGVPER